MNQTIYRAMTKAGNYKGYLIAVVLLVVCLVLYFNWDKIKQTLGMAPKLTSSPAGSPTTYATNTLSQSYNNDTILKKGMRGAKVKELQIMMNATLKAAKARGDQAAMSLDPIAEDGIFGNQTAMRLLALTGGQTQISINAYKKLEA